MTQVQEESLNPESAQEEPGEDMPDSGTESRTDPIPDAAAGTDAELEGLRQEMEAWKAKVEENRNLALRAQAEMENLRKRTAREVDNAYKFALDRFVADLLPVLDSMELGIEASGTDGGMDSVREGMALTLKKFRDTLEKFGVTVVDPNGEKFNPEKHEAVSMQEVEGAEPGTVLTVMQKGYELNGRLVRPAMVVVTR